MPNGFLVSLLHIEWHHQMKGNSTSDYWNPFFLLWIYNYTFCIQSVQTIIQYLINGLKVYRSVLTHISILTDEIEEGPFSNKYWFQKIKDLKLLSAFECILLPVMIYFQLQTFLQPKKTSYSAVHSEGSNYLWAKL